MVTDSNKPESAVPWAELAGMVNLLPAGDRRRFRRTLRTLAHDLRQRYGQVHSAEELLRRMLAEGRSNGEWEELLNVIRTANAKASDLLAEFAIDFVERIEID